MITVDHASAVPAFDQIRAQVAGLIRVGALGPGHRLPSIRQLAGDLGLAPGTVARAYAELEAAGLIRTSRLGALVADDQRADPALRTSARGFVQEARRAGVSLDDAIAALRASWAGA